MSRIQKSGGFGRNIFANVIANLVAGVIVYLLGITAGDFRASPALVIPSLAFLIVPIPLKAVMVIFGGYKYVTSAGDPSVVGDARNTIMYGCTTILAAPVLWIPARAGYSYAAQGNYTTPAQLSSWLLFVIVITLPRDS